ncbi:hypothetical protein [Kitasatospora sp. NPDC097643]|uniref:hypothetical protein n=1 Tax=Kitasatospora sp. NPDC097643 TaxID=3157230 RepID=UPI00331E1C07
MSNATVQARLAGFGYLEPDGPAFRLVNPISLAQLRQLASEDWISAVSTTDRAGRVRFRFIATVSGHQFTVTGRLTEQRRPGGLKPSPRWDELALFDNNSAATGHHQGGNNR